MIRLAKKTTVHTHTLTYYTIIFRLNAIVPARFYSTSISVKLLRGVESSIYRDSMNMIFIFIYIMYNSIFALVQQCILLIPNSWPARFHRYYYTRDYNMNTGWFAKHVHPNFFPFFSSTNLFKFWLLELINR